jgi:hypothetical protein
MTNNIPVDVPDFPNVDFSGNRYMSTGFCESAPNVFRAAHSLIPECNFKDKLLWHDYHQ